MKITDFLVMDANGDEIAADPQGTHLAFRCATCNYPVLASTLDNEPGSDEEHPTTCRKCKTRYFLDVRPHAEKLYVFDEPPIE